MLASVSYAQGFVGTLLTGQGCLEPGVGPYQAAVGLNLHDRNRKQPGGRHDDGHHGGGDLVRFRHAQRDARRPSGSRQAETGSSAIHRSTSSASARGGRSGPRAQGHRLEADGLQRRVDRRVDLPRRRELAPLNASEHRPTSSPSNGALPVSRQ